MSTVNLNVSGETMSYQILKIRGDGACLYNMLSMALFGSERFSVQVREDVVREVLRNFEFYGNFINRINYQCSSSSTIAVDVNGPMSPQEYSAHMLNPYSYGTFVEVSVASKIFCTRIHVLEERRNEAGNITMELYSDIGEPQWPIVKTMFSGDRDRGHFDLLWPIGRSPPSLLPYSLPKDTEEVIPAREKKSGRPKKKQRGKKRVIDEAERKRLERENETEVGKRARLDKQKLRSQKTRSVETEEEKQKRLEEQKLRSEKTRRMETEEEKEKRIEEQKLRNEKTRRMETKEEKEKRLEEQKLRNEKTRRMETKEEKEKRIEEQKLRNEKTRRMETKEEKEKRIEEQKLRNEKTRRMETKEEKEKRIEEQKLRNEKTRRMETEEEKEKRLEEMRNTERRVREKETEEERNKRLEELRNKEKRARETETEEERNKRLEELRNKEKRAREAETEEERNTRLCARRTRRSNETVEETQERLIEARERAVLPWKTLENSAFHYNPDVSYETNATISIGTMSIECTYCHALKWKGESPGMCCCNGKVKLEPLLEPPQPLRNLMTGADNRSKEFLENLRSYNSAFQMTSFGAQIVTEGKFMPTFKIQGQCYHLAGSLLPLTGSQPKFLQIYFMGNETLETERRCSVFPRVKPDIVHELQRMLHDHNCYIQSFKSAMEKQSEEKFKIIINADKKPASAHSGRFNAPSTNEVAVLIVGQEFEKRDIVLESRDGGLHRVSEIHRAYDALGYPMLYPRGEDTYCINIPQYDPITSQVNLQKNVSAMNFYAFRLMVRSGEFNHLHLCRQLGNQYWVDVYAKIETERLAYIKHNQKKLRAENYVHLKDAVERDGNVQDIGQMVILPSSFTGSPRYMHERTQDAMSYVRKYGRPDLFITFTCNPKWSEISDILLPGQQPQDRHDIVSRVFRLKVISLMNLSTKGKVFGSVLCHMYSIEWQKRGLPHAHILLWLEKKISPNDIDTIISAEIPNPSSDPVLHSIIVKHMVHGPCGTLYPSSPCMKDGKCSKRYPKAFNKDTKTGDDGYPTYRRLSPEDGGMTAQIKRGGCTITLDNSNVVPFCPLLSRIFNAHINVEFCNSIKSIKYVCKYINKGSDQAAFVLKSENDEIERYQVGRYISTSEGIWRIFSFQIHDRSPTVVHLAVHLENGQRVYFTEANVEQRVSNPPNTTLLAFFQLCQTDDFAKKLLYHEVPSYYTWNGKKFLRRKQGNVVPEHPEIRKSNALGRVYTVHPNNAECYYLRMLLHKIRGPTCFNDLKSANGQVLESFQAVCRAFGMLEDDNHWQNTLSDAAISESPATMRDLFVVILAFCQVTDAQLLWHNNRDQMTEDIFFQLRQSFPDIPVQHDDQVYCKGLMYIEDKLYSLTSKTLADFGFPPLQRDRAVLFASEYLRETSYNIEESIQFVRDNEDKLASEQKLAYLAIMESVNSNQGRLFFLDAPGGTGKTFLINLLLSKFRSLKQIAVAVASSGIAATLLQGGRTAHAAFKLPLNLGLTESPTCNIKKGTAVAKVLSNASIVIWDECTMSHKGGIEALDRTLRDLRGKNRLMGGVTMVLSGDFRQTLPVIQRGTRADEVYASIKSSAVWSYVSKLTLTLNMRVHLRGDSLSGEFAKSLLQVGDGRIPERNGEIEITSSMGILLRSLNELILHVFPDICNINQMSEEWLCERAILTPKNESALIINESLLSEVPGEGTTYESVDTVLHQDEATNYPVEFLNSLNPPGLPHHRLILKIGIPIMLLRNLNAPTLCNGTRLRVCTLRRNVIGAVVLTGCAAGKHVFIPRIPLIPSDYPFEFKRLQFPVKCCLAMTINKAQGQSFRIAGVDLRDPCFSHGQLYVAFSRVSKKDNLFILAPSGRTKNVVYKEALV